MGKMFPGELRQFYLQVGYGFLCKQDKNFIDRIMDPSSIADFILGEERYEYDDEYREMIDMEKEMVFFEVSEGSYLSLDLSKKDENGVCPVLYFQDEVAKSLEDFISKMDEEVDYYINY
ncbi:SMI1/KNR4 family protein [Clostridium sp. DJ247]|uniref:SMI1/KNR4 family protein n=1 Tax=Clostridium sp. DJ247 TaxID=2726188 RepID=UPI0016241D26|nr:SMI1/KNR4 family protein [Clostridium sp. DJ247]MBC2582763.1 SMI1/KNR4 family protein [Clostridium sp. DJ247]